MAKQPNQKNLTKKHLARMERERIQQRYLVIGTIVVLVFVVGIVLYGILDQTVLKNIRPVAKVGSDTITTAAFQKEVRFQRYRLIDQLQSLMGDPMAIQFFGQYIQQISTELSSPNSIGQNVLDSMVENDLVQKEAAKRGITVSDAEVNQAFEAAFGYYPNGTPTPTVTSTPYNTPTLNSQQETLLPPTSTPGPTENSFRNGHASRGGIGHCYAHGCGNYHTHSSRYADPGTHRDYHAHANPIHDR